MKRWWTLMTAAMATGLLLAACQPKLSAPPAPVIPGVKPLDAAGTASQCVNQCITRNQARAMSIDAIESDCRATCGKTCMDECKTRSAMRAVSADQIDVDCKKTCGL